MQQSWHAPDRLLVGSVSIGLAGLVLLPIVLVVLGAFVPTDRLGLGLEAGEPLVANAEALRYLWRNYGEWLLFSGRVALITIGIALVTAVPAGYVLVQRPFFGSRLLEELVLLPLSLPGIAVSIALLAAYPSERGLTLVVAGHLLYTLPFMLRVVTASLRTRDVAELEAAARTLGASFGQRMLWIVLPQLRQALVVGALLVFAVSWGEFNVSYLLNSGHPQTFPAALYNTYANESLQRSCAATALFLLGLVPALLAIQWFESPDRTVR